MMGYSRGTICGNVGGPPELRYTPNGTPVCNFSVAVNRKRKDQETVNWYRVTLFGVTAENADRLITKGERVLVDGEIQLNYFIGNDGQERHSLEIVGGTFLLLGSGPPESGNDRTADPGYIPEEELDDIPF